MLSLESNARDIILVPGVDTTGIEMYTESMQIAELFRDPRKIQRATPFNRVISATYGNAPTEFQQQGGDRGPSGLGPKPMPPPPPMVPPLKTGFY